MNFSLVGKKNKIVYIYSVILHPYESKLKIPSLEIERFKSMGVQQVELY